uniref:Uncharacterized protein n=1 Tax=Chlorobium phaeovibrioides (strain DSM 265 / 1930) TaxID=290318 RepID=A4SDR2_CHLPM
MEYFAYSAIQWVFYLTVFFYYSKAEEAVYQSTNTNDKRTMKKLFIFLFLLSSVSFVGCAKTEAPVEAPATEDAAPEMEAPATEDAAPEMEAPAAEEAAPAVEGN